MASYLPSSGSMSGARPLATASWTNAGPVRPVCWARAASARWLSPAVTKTWLRAATSSRIRNRSSHPSTCCGACDGGNWSWMAPWPAWMACSRSVTWPLSVVTVSRCPPVIAAEPILTGPQADKAHVAAAAAAITNTKVRGTTASLLVWASGGRHVRRDRAALAEHRLDELSAPGKQLPVTQERGTRRDRRPGAGTGYVPGHRYEHRTHRRLEHRLRVQPLRPHLPRFWQVHRREPDVGAL